MIELSTDRLYRMLDDYEARNPASHESRAFEEKLESSMFTRLKGLDELGWDFDTATDFFGERGLSILIQNASLDWPSIWSELVEAASCCPKGVLINFEVTNAIRRGVMQHGDQLTRRIIDSEGTYIEEPDIG